MLICVNPGCLLRMRCEKSPQLKALSEDFEAHITNAAQGQALAQAMRSRSNPELYGEPRPDLWNRELAKLKDVQLQVEKKFAAYLGTEMQLKILWGQECNHEDGKHHTAVQVEVDDAISSKAIATTQLEKLFGLKYMHRMCISRMTFHEAPTPAENSVMMSASRYLSDTAQVVMKKRMIS